MFKSMAFWLNDCQYVILWWLTIVNQSHNIIIIIRLKCKINPLSFTFYHFSPLSFKFC